MKRIMKISINRSSQVLVLTSLLMFGLCMNQTHAQGTSINKNIDKLLGTWTFDYQASVGNMSQGSKAHLNKMHASRKDRLSEIFMDRKVTFSADSSFVQVLADGRTTNAKWSTDNNVLKISTPSGKNVLFRIKKLESDNLILSPINTTGGSMKVLFTNWHLTKN